MVVGQAADYVHMPMLVCGLWKLIGSLVSWQFDFHTYCLRKMTLRAYVTLLQCEDTIYKHKFFVRAALSLVETYMALFDKPGGATAEEADPELEVPSRWNVDCDCACCESDKSREACFWLSGDSTPRSVRSWASRAWAGCL